MLTASLLPFAVDLTPAPAPIKVQAPSPEQIKQQVIAEKRAVEYARVERAAVKMYRSLGCSTELSGATARAAVDMGVSVRLLSAVLFVESSCGRLLIGATGDVGPAQINWRVHREHTREELLRDKELNCHVGARILAANVRKFGVREGLRHYNGIGSPDHPTGYGYADRVLSKAGMAG
jgi:hypothetical protein